MEKPKAIENIDIARLKTQCEEYIAFVDNDEEYSEDSDHTHYIYEVAMETIFGPSVWSWINNRRK